MKTQTASVTWSPRCNEFGVFDKFVLNLVFRPAVQVAEKHTSMGLVRDVR